MAKKTKKTAKKPARHGGGADPKKVVSKTAHKGGIIPMADRVLIKEMEARSEEKTVSGIILPTSAEKDAGIKRGKVVATGPGKYENGVFIKVSAKVGDTVLFQWGDKITVNGEEYYMVRDSEIAATLN